MSLQARWEDRLPEAIRFFWKTRRSESDRQGARTGDPRFRKQNGCHRGKHWTDLSICFAIFSKMQDWIVPAFMPHESRIAWLVQGREEMGLADRSRLTTNRRDGIQIASGFVW